MVNRSLKELLARLCNLHPIGSCYTTSSNTNPSTWLGGTWTLIHKEFKSQWISSGFTFNTTNTQDGAFVAILNGTTITFRFTWANKVAISDTTTPIGTLSSFASVGLVNAHEIYAVGYSDGLNAIGVFGFHLASTGNRILEAYDWVTRATSYPTTTGQNCDLEFTINVRQDCMLDSFCDKFVWKRTA